MTGAERTLVFVSAVAVVTVATVSALGVGLAAAARHVGSGGAVQKVTAATTLGSGRGKLVFSDDFSHSWSGWTTSSESSGTTFAYSGGHYVVVAKGSFDHFARSPYLLNRQQMGISVTATQSSDAPEGAGFGASCRRGQSEAQTRYEFLIHVGGTWSIYRRDGVVNGDTSPYSLKLGSLPVSPGPRPVTVVAMCATLADNHTTRLAMFVNGSAVADIYDAAPALSDSGWLSGLVVASFEPTPSTVIVSRFEERDLAR